MRIHQYVFVCTAIDIQQAHELKSTYILMNDIVTNSAIDDVYVAELNERVCFVL